MMRSSVNAVYWENLLKECIDKRRRDRVSAALHRVLPELRIHPLVFYTFASRKEPT